MLLTSQSLEHLQENYYLDDAIVFVKKCLQQHAFSDNTATEIKNSLILTEEKRKDDKLYLGIIGEASSGKSTLINALLGTDLLRSGNSLGTTVTSTVISYGEEITLEIVLPKYTYYFPEETALLIGHGYDPKASLLENVRNIITEVTTKETIAGGVSEIRVTYPSNILKKGLVIIDTPGVNHQNKRHAKVTSNMIRQQCDAAIVVMNATAPTSDSLMVYLAEHLREMLHRSLFVVAQADVIALDERDEVKEDIEYWLQDGLELSAPKVVPITSIFAMEAIGLTISPKLNSFSDGERKQFINEFRDFENLIFKTLAAKRTQIIFERVFLSFGLLLKSISAELDALRETYESERRALDNAMLDRPKAYATTQREKYSRQFSVAAVKIRAQVERFIKSDRRKLLQKAKSAINEPTSLNALQSNLEETLDRVFTMAEKRTSETITYGQSELDNAYNEVMENFIADFHKIYGKLASLNGKLTAGVPKVNFNLSKTTFSSLRDRSISGAVEIASQEFKSSADSLKGGLAAGILLGLIFPGIGFFIGGALGAIFGDRMGPKLEESKSKIVSSLEPELIDHQRKVKKKVLSQQDEMNKQGQASIRSIIDQSFTLYDQLVDKMKARDQKQREEIGGKITRIKQDHKSATDYAEKLQQGRQHLAKL